MYETNRQTDTHTHTHTHAHTHTHRGRERELLCSLVPRHGLLAEAPRRCARRRPVRGPRVGVERELGRLVDVLEEEALDREGATLGCQDCKMGWEMERKGGEGVRVGFPSSRGRAWREKMDEYRGERKGMGRGWMDASSSALDASSSTPPYPFPRSLPLPFPFSPPPPSPLALTGAPREVAGEPLCIKLKLATAELFLFQFPPCVPSFSSSTPLALTGAPREVAREPLCVQGSRHEDDLSGGGG
jgi:hypothetical protein